MTNLSKPVLLLILIIGSMSQNSFAQKITGDSTCNCVAFRLDDIQDDWLNYVQIQVIDTFHQKNASLTIGIIGNYFGKDPLLVSHIKQSIKQNHVHLEIANHGWNHEDFTQLTREQQSILMKNTNDKIHTLFGVTPSVFIPPFNAINSDTMAAFLENNFQYISANTTQDIPSSFIKNAVVYHFPSTAKTGDLNDDNTYWYGENHKQTFVEIIDSLQKYGYAVVEMHPYEYSMRHNMDMQNRVYWNQINELELLIDELRNDGINIVTISDIPKHTTSQKIPAWTNNLFTWHDDEDLSSAEVHNALNYLFEKKIITQ